MVSTCKMFWKHWFGPYLDPNYLTIRWYFLTIFLKICKNTLYTRSYSAVLYNAMFWVIIMDHVISEPYYNDTILQCQTYRHVHFLIIHYYKDMYKKVWELQHNRDKIKGYTVFLNYLFLKICTGDKILLVRS